MYSCITYCLIGQNSLITPSLPTIIPTAPEASKLIGQIQFPVSYNTGLATIEIPIYEIKLSNLTIPIKLSYTSSGFKPNIFSEVGTGWSFIAEPQVARQVNGHPDEQYFLRSGFGNFTKLNDADLATMFYNQSDQEFLPDQFFYKLPKRSGSFFTNRDYYNQEITGFATVPYEPIKISSNSQLSQIDIIDSDGTVYQFTGQESSSNITGPYYYSAFKAKSITTPHNEIVTFQYNSPVRKSNKKSYVEHAQLDILQILNQSAINGSLKYSGCDILSYRSQYGINSDVGSCPTSDYSKDYFDCLIKYQLFKPTEAGGTRTLYHVKRGNGMNDNELSYMASTRIDYNDRSQTSTANFCSKITFPGGTVNIVMIRPPARYNSENEVIMKEIIVRNEQQDIIRWVKFDIDYSGWERPRLDAVLFCDKTGVVQECYSMEYNGADTNFLSYHDYSSDRVNSWGYITSNDLQIPNISFKRSFYLNSLEPQLDNLHFKTGDDRDYYYTEPYTYPQVTMLKKITYPTGGYSTFEYEPARFFHPKKLQTLYDGCQRIKKIDNYTLDGQLASRRSFKYGANESGLGMAVQPLNDEDFITSKLISVYINNGSNSWDHEFNIHRTEISSRPLMDDYLEASSSIVYDQVTEYIEDAEGNNSGKTEYIYDYSNLESIRNRRLIEADDEYPDSPYLPIYKSDYLKKYKAWDTGKQKEVNTYKKVGKNYSLISKNSFSYLSKGGETVKMLLYHPLFDIMYKNPPCGEMSQLNMALGQCMDSPKMRFIFRGDNSFVSGAKLLQQKEEIQYTDDGEIRTTSSYKYNDNLMPTETIVTDSENNLRKQENKYPQDYSDNVSVEMVKRNIIEPVIGQFSYLGTTPLYKSFSPYKIENNIFVPHYIETAKGDEPMKQEILFDKYDSKGNILGITQKGSLKATYLWGYGSLFPVAKIEGMSYSEVEQAIGISTIQQIANANVPSILQSYCDNIRTSLSSRDVLVTTYTYKPLVGVASITDPSGIVIYYEYDDHNRLKEIYIIENNVRKIIQAYSYAY